MSFFLGPKEGPVLFYNNWEPPVSVHFCIIPFFPCTPAPPPRRKTVQQLWHLKIVHRLWGLPFYWLKNGALLLLQGFSHHIITIHFESGQFVLSYSLTLSLRPVDGLSVKRAACLGTRRDKRGITNSQFKGFELSPSRQACLSFLL